VSKSFILLILVVLIAYSLSFIPINDNLIDFSFIDGFLDTTPETEAPATPHEYLFETSESGVLHNPDTVDFHFSTTEKDYPLSTDLLLEIYEEDRLVKTYGGEILTATNQEEDADTITFTVTLSLSLKTLDLEPGSYQARILPQDEAFKEKILDLELHYSGEYTYERAVDAPPSGRQFIKLYFADQQISYLFPVHRAIDQTDQLIRTTLRNLEEGPSESLGLYEKSVAPYSSRALLEDDIVTLYFTSPEVAPYNQGSTASTFAVDALVNTMTGIPYINGIRILVDSANPGSDYFHGMTLDGTLTPLDWPLAYLGFETATQRILLNPAGSRTLNEESLFEALKGDFEEFSAYYSNPSTLLPVPGSLALSTWVMEGSVIVLNIEGDLDAHFYKREKNFDLMVDALVNSYASLPGIEGVKLNFLSHETQTLYGYDFSESLSPKPYFNIE